MAAQEIKYELELIAAVPDLIIGVYYIACVVAVKSIFLLKLLRCSCIGSFCLDTKKRAPTPRTKKIKRAKNPLNARTV